MLKSLIAFQLLNTKKKHLDRIQTKVEVHV